MSIERRRLAGSLVPLPSGCATVQCAPAPAAAKDNDSVNPSVLLVHQRAAVRRLLRLNLELEGVRVVEAATAPECLRQLHSQPFAALVVDPEVFADPRHEAALGRLIRRLRLPTLVVANGPEHRHFARRLGDASYIARPDALERLVTAVLALIAGISVPTVL